MFAHEWCTVVSETNIAVLEGAVALGYFSCNLPARNFVAIQVARIVN